MNGWKFIDVSIWCLQVSCWIQHLIPKIEDGNDFGVAIQVRQFFCFALTLRGSAVPAIFHLNLKSVIEPQEKILERIAAVKTKVDGFQTNINK